MSDDYFLKTGEYAKRLGITKEALRSKRRRGQLENEFINKNGIYLWREPASKHRSDHGVKAPKSPATRSRGNHIKGRETKYPNRFFEQHNEVKMLARLQSNVDQETQELLPEALEIAKAKKREKLQREINQKPKKNYGGRIDPRIDQIQRENRLRFKNYAEIQKEDNAWKGGNSFYLSGKPFTYGAPTEDDTIAVEPSRSNNLNERPKFKSKVDEHIWMLKNKKR